jgi:HEAT repeat protein
MGPPLLRLSFFCLVAFFPLSANFSPNRVLFLLNHGQIDQAVCQYEKIQEQKGKHDFELLHQMCLSLLEFSMRSSSPEDQLLAVFGAGLALNDQTFYLLEQGLRSSYPQIQVAALSFLAQSQNDEAYSLIEKLLGSPYGIIRLEAAYQLAKIKHPKATAQIEALMQKVPPEALPIFPKMLALIGDASALKILRKCMSHTNHEVRIAAILGSAEFGRDDLLPQIRKLASQHDARQQETAAFALGIFQDHHSKQILARLAGSPHSPVRLAALKSLIMLGEKDKILQIEQLALQGDLFAIQCLGEIPHTEETLFEIANSNNLLLRLNGSLALLKRNDRRSLLGILEILVRDNRDLAYTEMTTPGKALTAWRAVPSASHQGEESSLLIELSLAFREEILTQCLELPAKDFLALARHLFDKKQNDLVPLLINLLINLDTRESIDLLKELQQKTGAPLIRNYASLALVKLKEEGPYMDLLGQSILNKQEIDMMKFRTLIPFELREEGSHFELLPHESARLLIESLEVLSETDPHVGINILLTLLKEGHSRNRPVIAGLILQISN